MNRSRCYAFGLLILVWPVCSFGCLRMAAGAYGIASLPYLLIHETPDYLASAHSGVTSAEFSPDGSHILATYRVRDRSTVYRVSLDGTMWIPLTDDGFASSAAYSPDGTKIAFRLGRNHRHGALYSMNADGSSVQRLTRGRRDALNPSFSPDGTQIVFTSRDRDGWSDTRMAGIGGGHVTQLTQLEEGYESDPEFLPDGEAVLFRRSTYTRSSPRETMTRKREICTVRADGTGFRTIQCTEGWAMSGQELDADSLFFVHGDRLLKVDATDAHWLASHGVPLLTAYELPADLDHMVLYAVAPDGKAAIAARTPVYQGRQTSSSFDWIVYRHDIEAGKSHELLRREITVHNVRYAPDGATALFIVRGAGPPQTKSQLKVHEELWVTTPGGTVRRIDTLSPDVPKWVL